MGAVLTRLDYMSDEISIGGGATYWGKYELFGSRRTPAEGSMLFNGRLAQSAQGQLVFAGAQLVSRAVPATAAANAARMRALLNAHRNLIFRVWVGDVKAIEAPLTMFGLPVGTLQGSSDSITAALTGSFAPVFSGAGPSIPGQFVPHDVPPNATLRMEVEGRTTVPLPFDAADSDNVLGIYGVLGFSTRTALTAGPAVTQ